MIPATHCKRNKVGFTRTRHITDIGQQPPYDDRKYSNTLPQKRGDTKLTGKSYNLDQVRSGSPDVRSLTNVLCTSGKVPKTGLL